MLENQTRSLECCVNLLSLAIINNRGDCFNKESMLILITEISAHDILVPSEPVTGHQIMVDREWWTVSTSLLP